MQLCNVCNEWGSKKCVDSRDECRYLFFCCLQMQMWAESKQQPGQFTGSTGARVLSAAELASGFQAWAKKVQEALEQLTVCVFWHFCCLQAYQSLSSLNRDSCGLCLPYQQLRSPVTSSRGAVIHHWCLFYLCYGSENVSAADMNIRPLLQKSRT